MATLITLGVLASLQIVVRMRFFLHIRFSQRRDDLPLILFVALPLPIMMVGTVLLMASLALRMDMSL